MSKRKYLWNGDACIETGFARVTRNVCTPLGAVADVSVLGINYFGDPHGPTCKGPHPYAVYPAAGGGDAFGIQRVPALLKEIRPDLLVVMNDPWNVKHYVQRFASALPVVAYMPVDGKNCQGRELNGLSLAIFYTQFGLDEARKGGYSGKATIIPHGVDTSIYRPMDRAATRERMGITKRLGEDLFIVGNINRNQPRKRLDLTIAYFAEWVKTRRIDNAYLYLHLAPTGDKGWDVRQLCDYYGIGNKLIITSSKMVPGVGVSEQYLAGIYNCFDAMMTTTQGEGWGLPTMEAMACGIPQIVPDWAALGEWPGDAVLKVPCTSTAATVNDVNVIGGLADKELMLQALDKLYGDKATRVALGQAGYDRVHRPEFTWENVAKKFELALETGGDELHLDVPTEVAIA